MPEKELRDASVEARHLSDAEKDRIEESVYGNYSRQPYKEKHIKISKYLRAKLQDSHPPPESPNPKTPSTPSLSSINLNTKFSV